MKSVKRAGIAALTVLAVVLSGLAWNVSRQDLHRYAGVDLRPKVIGARQLLAHQPLYVFEWTPERGERYLDPAQRYPGPSRTTYSPPLMLLYVPLANTAYATQHTFWFWAEWAALFMSLWLLSRLIPSRRGRVWFWIGAGLFFVSSYFWRLHVERGQYYVWILLLSVSALTALRNKDDRWGIAGIPLGIVAAFRPTYLIIAVLFFLLRRRREAASMLASFALLISVTLCWGGTAIWKDYLQNIRETEHIMVEPGYVDKRFGPAHAVPMTAEGKDFSITLPSRTTSVTFLDYFLARVRQARSMGWSIDPNLSLINKVLLITMSLTFMVLCWRARDGRWGYRTVFLTVFVVALNTDYFLPQRYGYVDILFLLPLTLVLTPLIRGRAGIGATIAVLIALAGGRIPWIPVTDWSFVTSLRSLLVMGTLNILVLVHLWRASRPEIRPSLSA